VIDVGDQKVLTLAEAARFLHVHPITLYRMVKIGSLPGAFRIGRVWRINREDLERFAAESGEKDRPVLHRTRG
jgi:excisionase family DNA binding protein